MNLASLIDRMIAAGMSPGEAGSIAAEIYAAGVASATAKTSGAARQQRYRERHQTSQSVTSLRSDEASQSVTNRNETSQSDALPNPPISTSKISKESKRQNRGTRIASDWILSDAERAFAKHEGFSDFEINREVNKFRDYWTACAGSKGVKLDWPATWRQWIRSGAERAGKTPTNIPQNIPSFGFYAKADSEQLAAWDAWAVKANGKSLPRDKNGGWNVKAEWPPDYVRPEKVREMSATPMFRSMS